MRVVYAQRTVLKSHPGNGSNIQLMEGQPWHGDHPLVAAYPDCFADIPPQRLIQGVPAEDTVIEQATRAPGEKRRTRRG